METFEPITFYIDYEGDRLEIKALPHNQPVNQNIPLRFDIVIGETPKGIIEQINNKWESSDIQEQTLVESIGNNILKYYR